MLGVATQVRTLPFKSDEKTEKKKDPRKKRTKRAVQSGGVL